jgi:GrpB-like predicted nucleotidyltransferase (UPF0157 family)
MTVKRRGHAIIELHAYKRSWPGEFASIRADLAAALGDRARHIAHIGSTAVPGMAAKDIIDIQVSVQSLDQDLVSALTARGYEYAAEHGADHIPPDATDPPESWVKLYFRGAASSRACHVHVRVWGNANQRYALLFRDYLRAHPSSRRTLEVVKRELVRLHANDEDAYYAIKDPVHDLIWHSASEWAQRSGWHQSTATEA